MKVPPFSRLRAEDFPGADQNMIKLIDSVNLNIESIYLALNRGLSFNENIQCDIHHARLRTENIPYKFRLILRVVPFGVFIVKAVKESAEYVALSDPVWCDWTHANGEVTIQSISGLTAGERYNITFMVV